MGRRVFFTEVWTWIHCPQSAVRSPQSTIKWCSVWCLLYNVVGEPFLLVSRVVIAMFWKAKISFSLVKNIVFPRLQNMDLVWTQKWRKIFYLKMNRNISRGSNMLTQLRSLGSVRPVGTERYFTVLCSSKSFWYELLKFRFDFPNFYLVHHSQNRI